MATKAGIGKLKHKLTGLRRSSAKVLKKTNSLVSGAINQLRRADKNKHKAKASSASSGGRKAATTAKSAGPVKAVRAGVKAASGVSATARKKTRSTAHPAVTVAVPPVVKETPRLRPSLPKTVRAAAAAATSPVKTVVAPLQQRAGSVLDFQLPDRPSLRRLAPMTPSPDSRASRATSKGKHAALSTAKAAAIQDAGAMVTEGSHETV